MQEIKALIESVEGESETPVEIEWHFDEDMARHTTFKAGGRASALAVVHNVASLRLLLRVLSRSELPRMLLGNGSNTLFRDGGYRGVVVKLGSGFTGSRVRGTDLECSCGLLLSKAAAAATEAELTGLEFASGIPGSVGGAVFMNAGAYGGEMKDVVKLVRLVPPDGGETVELSGEAMEFGYRKSVLQSNGYVAYQVVFGLEAGVRAEIAERVAELAAQRRAKQPLEYPSAGSTFKRPEGHFAGKLIQDAGLRGVSVGGAKVSELHSGFIINEGNATAKDILQLISLIRNTVYDKFGIMLEPEMRIVGED